MTTYAVSFQNGERKENQSYSSAKEAGEAFAKIDASHKPSVVKSVPGVGTKVLAATYAKNDGELTKHHKYHDHTDKEFAQALYQKERSIEREKEAEREREKLEADKAKQRNGSEIATPAIAASLTAHALTKETEKGDQQEIAKAQGYKTYNGPVVEIREHTIIQEHTDKKSGEKQLIEHNKSEVSHFKDRPESIGKPHQISYAAPGKGLSREISQHEMTTGKHVAHDREAGRQDKAATMERGR